MNLSAFSRDGLEDWPLENGLQGQMTRGTYDSIPALSNTVLKKWLVLQATPTEFKWWLEHRWNEDPTPALAMGSALDSLLLEYEKVPDRFVVFTKDGPKRVSESHRDANPGKIVMTHEQFQSALKMAEALNTSPHSSYGEDFAHCSKQVAVAELFGAPFKCEFDMWTENSEDVCDVKSARDVTPTAFGKAAAEYGYFYQASLYLAIARALKFDKRSLNFICIKNEEPWTIKPYRFRPFENPKHKEIFNGCMARFEEGTATLLQALGENFEENLLWEDITVPPWHLNALKTESTERYLHA